jgi:hypothetical protein
MQFSKAARQCVLAAKAIKDIAHNILDFEASTNDILHHEMLSCKKSPLLALNNLEKETFKKYNDEYERFI